MPLLWSIALSLPSAYAFEPLPLRRLVCQEATQAAALIELDNQLLSESLAAGDRASLLAAIDNSLAYMETPDSVTDYENYSVSGVTHSRVQRSLIRFRTLLLESESAADLQAAIANNFTFYQSIGQDEAGTVAFTGYFEPTYTARLTQTDKYKYPLYKSPPNLETWAEPHPTRLELEGADGLQADQGPLKGLELVWLSSRLEAFLTQVQGSARLQLTDGSTLSVGYDGRTNYPYTSMGRALIDDGIISEEELTLPVLLEYFEQNPEALDRYLPRNDRFIFFRKTDGAPATGSLGFPVTAGRSIATDKSVMPPGALALINLNLPQINSAGEVETKLTSRFVLDQDTGGAIKGAGRVDIFIGTGTDAGKVAGLINSTGTLYYLLLKE
ncbi:MAG: murein transglycosylase [Leptolyngbya foveolarum]|uniref:peptidoglycan lytic exotransglycosylase n=1 Tax=Leptolyngbya foveolarum TaxID=47253 RepID=A0A2W4U907_9CYAN|nr:MAG: murein transglycosylase [Leptolyngbya foveolarum]